MPFHEKYRKDKDGNVIKDENNNLIVDLEGVDYNKFPKNFLAETKAEADKLYNKYLATLKFLADKYSRLTGLGSEDFIQEGVIGLARASRDFISERSRDFNTFAIYKIKDSMREFVSSQAATIKIPQYIKDAIGLYGKLKRLISTVEPIEHASFMDVWDTSKKYEKSGEIVKDTTNIRKSISNLAERSCTTVKQLIERAELMPSDFDTTVIDHNTADITNGDEEELVNRISTRKSIETIKDLLTKSDYELIVAHLVDGKTVRDLAKETGLAAPTVTIKVHNIMSELIKRKDIILNNANYKNIKKARERNIS